MAQDIANKGRFLLPEFAKKVWRTFMVKKEYEIHLMHLIMKNPPIVLLKISLFKKTVIFSKLKQEIINCKHYGNFPIMSY